VYKSSGTLRNFSVDHSPLEIEYSSSAETRPPIEIGFVKLAGHFAILAETIHVSAETSNMLGNIVESSAETANMIGKRDNLFAGNFDPDDATDEVTLRVCSAVGDTQVPVGTL
jgi:hypothetical protein